MRRPQLTTRTLMILVALAAVSMSVAAGVVQWRRDMRPLWDVFRSQTESWEAAERNCLNSAALAEQRGDAAKAKWYHGLAIKYARKKREYQGRWW